MSALGDIRKKTSGERSKLEKLILSCGYMTISDNHREQAAAELAALRAKLEQAREEVTRAQTLLRSTAANWQEQCLFDADEALTAALKALEE